MKKNGKLLHFEGLSLSLKLFRIMKLTCALILLVCLQVSAAGFSQSRITVNFQAQSLKKALSYIEKKSDYRFLYNENLVADAPKVTLIMTDAEVTDVLKHILDKTGLSFQMMANNLVVLKTGDVDLADIHVTGKVTGSTGDPIAGASVSVKGAAGGVATDAQGNFSITVPENAVLVISSVGFVTAEIAVNKRTSVNISLQATNTRLDEVVVIGYGQASKRDLTGSIAKVAGKEVQDKPNTNPIASLQGKVAGLSVVNNGTPGAAPDIRIRGTVSIGQVHPLYVVDGIFNDNIDYINPNDIESIEILKDPSSLAIFGVKGATGVIAITTKKARVGQVVINYNTSYGFKKLVDKIKLVDANGFNTLFKEENDNNGNPTPDYSALTANTDWIDAVTRTGQFMNHNLSVSASSEKNRFNLGVGYISDEGIIKQEKLQKWLLSFSDELKIGKAFKLGINLNASRTNYPYNATGILDEARKVMPQVSAKTKKFHVQDPYGTDSLDLDIYSGLDVALQNSGVVNPLLELENTWDKTINIEYREVGSIYGELTFLKYFTLRSTLYADISNVNDRSYQPLYYAYDPLSNKPYLYSDKTQVTENDNTWRKYQQDHILTFRRSFGQHNITATAGFTTYYFGNFNRTGIAKPFSPPTGLPIPNDPRFWYMTTQFEDPNNTVASSSQTEYTTVSALARALYNYQNKYYLNVSFRDDASSQIPPNNRHQQFWAVGAAWEISKEKFMQSVSVIDYLKLKGSVGVLGNQTATDIDGTPIPYPFYPRLNTNVSAGFGPYNYLAAQPSYIANPDLKWETVSAQEAGFELNAYRNRLHVEFNYYNKKTDNLMTYVDRSPLGLKNELINGGSIRNWGEEISASWVQNFNRSLTLNIAGNITFLKNKVISLAKDLPAGYLSRGFQNNGSAEARTVAGYPIGVFWGYVVEGVYQSYADILKSPVASSVGQYRPGDLKFKDLNGDGQITALDRTMIGNPTPKFTYGSSISLTYKQWLLGVDVVGVYGNQVFRTWGSLESPFQRVNYPEEKLNRWHGAGTSNWTPIISQADRFNYNGSTYNIEDGSYFRVRNIQLSYSFDRRLINKYKMNNLRLFANVQNLKTWKNNLGYTAEFGGDATAFGFDNAGGAIPIVTTFGLNVTF